MISTIVFLRFFGPCITAPDKYPLGDDDAPLDEVLVIKIRPVLSLP